MARASKPISNPAELPPELLWLSDAPLFLDERLVGRVYDAVVQPTYRDTKLIETDGQEVKIAIAGKGGGEIKIGLPEFLKLLKPVFPSVEATVGGELGGTSESTQTGERSVERVPIENPQRQLLLLTIHYLQLHAAQQTRAYIVRDPSQEAWRTPDFIRAVPRALVFLELPGHDEATSPLIPTMLIPTAAEFEKGGVVELFSKSPGVTEAGPYPERAKEGENLRELRRKYWNAFQKHFSATKAMKAVEDEARERGRIRWIDYRLPITDLGDTLHLHFVPSGDYDTGTFAYNLIKRGFKHGLRLVGTLKSEPDLNVLAVYER
jgi:hypothetical protein